MSQATCDKVLIMAGGTGGHVFPALTIAQELMARGAAVEWLGTRQGIEARVIGETAIPLHFISVSGLRGKSLLRKLLAPLVVGLAVCQAMVRIWQIKPACVLGMGGFVTGPGGVAARLLRKPLLIHEQNAIAGLTNYLLYPMATVVMEGFVGAFVRKRALTRNKFLKSWVKPGKEIMVGNPVRVQLAEAESVRSDPETRQFRLLIVGGSLGATALNAVVPAMLGLFADGKQPEVLHQCGTRNLDDTLAAYRQAGLAEQESVSVQPFIEDMAAAYSWADLVICRSGASTIAELSAMGCPAILIPYAHAVDDHQTENARVMVACGGAILLPQSSLNAHTLYTVLAEKIQDAGALRTMGLAARNLAAPHSASRAADLCQEVCHG